MEDQSSFIIDAKNVIFSHSDPYMNKQEACRPDSSTIYN